MSDGCYAELLADLLGMLRSREGVEVQAVLVLRTGQTIALAWGELARVDDDDQELSWWCTIGGTRFAIDADAVVSVTPGSLDHGRRTGVTIELPLYELTIHWPTEEER